MTILFTEVRKSVKNEQAKASGQWEIQIMRWDGKNYLLSRRWCSELPVVNAIEGHCIEKVAAFPSLREVIIWVTPNA